MKEKWEQFKAWINKNKVAAGAGAIGIVALFYFWFKSRGVNNTAAGEVATMSYSPGSGGSGGGGSNSTSSDVETLSTVLKAGFEQQNSSLANTLEGFADVLSQSQQRSRYTGERATDSAMTPNIPTPAFSASFVQPASIIGPEIIPWEEWPEYFTNTGKVIKDNLPKTDYSKASKNAPKYDTINLGGDKGITSDGEFFTANSIGDRKGSFNRYGEFTEAKSV